MIKTVNEAQKNSAWFVVFGKPQGKGRPRFTRNGRTYTPKETVAAEKRFRAEYFNQTANRCFTGAIKVTISAYYAIPKGTSKKKRELMLNGFIAPTTKPDVDNVGKLVLDSLNGTAYTDDANVVELTVRKKYGDIPRVVTIIEDYENAEQ